MKISKHIHRYRRKPHDKVWYICGFPECYHYIHRDLLLGKLSVCNNCGKDFTLDNYALRVATPQCLNCRDTKSARNRRLNIANFEEELITIFEKEEFQKP